MDDDGRKQGGLRQSTAADDLSSARGRFFNPRRNPVGFARKNQRSDLCLRQ
jgi:hypothetical protein